MNLIMYKLLLWKNYIMQGYALTQILKYFLLLSGVYAGAAGVSFWLIMFLGVVYVLICLILGFVWYRYGLVNAEREIANQYDPLAKQLRGKFRMTKDIKSIKS